MRFLLLFLLSFQLYAAAPIYTSAEIPFGVSVSLGKVQDSQLVRGFVARSDVGTTLETVWVEGGNYVFPPAATKMTVSSSDANDTLLGTGLRKVTVQGLDANHDPISEDIDLNGLTGVTTVNSYLRIQGPGFIGKEAGSLTYNAGTVYIGTGTVTAGKPAVVYNLIAPTDNASHSGFFTIPRYFRGTMMKINSSVESNKFIEMDIFHKPNGVWQRIYGFHLSGGSKESDSTYPDVFPEKTDFDVKAKIDVGTGGLKSIFHMMLIRI